MQILPRDRRGIIRAVCILGTTILFLVLVGLYTMAMPGRTFSGQLPPLTSEEASSRDQLKRHIEKLAGQIRERNIWHGKALNASAEYIHQTLEGLGYKVAEQPFKAQGKDVRNLDVELTGGARPEETLVIGAHYDSVLDCPGANDNGSGVAAVLEIARQIRGLSLQRTVRLVAFVNEEAPFFGTGAMGSLVYARRMHERREKVIGMLSLETIGYYSDVKGSQNYPFPFNLAYPDTGNFIGFVGNVASRDFLHHTIELFRKNAAFPSEGVAAPEWMPGITWSDHWSFWEMGYPALMVTDTAPFRYPYYHTSADTPDKIDFDRLARVVTGLAKVTADLAGRK